MKCQILFSRKNKKNIIGLLSAELSGAWKLLTLHNSMAVKFVSKLTCT